MSALEMQFDAIFRELWEMLTADDITRIQNLVNAGEIGVAFENFCTQLYERDAVLSRDELQHIAALGNALGIRPDYWGNFFVR